jgi:hypothetical protein
VNTLFIRLKTLFTYMNGAFQRAKASDRRVNTLFIRLNAPFTCVNGDFRRVKAPSRRVNRVFTCVKAARTPFWPSKKGVRLNSTSVFRGQNAVQPPLIRRVIGHS